MLTHVVYTRDAAGSANIYVNGFVQAIQERSEEISQTGMRYTS
jgi:hypothetical protein